jgi:HD-GYP domain-containing protein (c-di-GMP phosphodiesterase class II)
MFQRCVPWSTVIAFLGVSFYLLARRSSSSKNQKHQIDLKSQDRRRAQHLEPSRATAMDALDRALDLKSAELKRHSNRVTAFAIAIAKVLGLPCSCWQPLRAGSWSRAASVLSAKHRSVKHRSVN